MSIAYPQAPPSRQFEESTRTAALGSYDLAALRDSPALRAITDFAGTLCETPVALISLVEETRQTFIARTGLEAAETPRETSFCAHAMLGDAIMEVPDASADPRFADYALVTGETQIRFYAGAPLVNEDGVPLGALCVFDTVPRPAGLTAMQRQGLAVLAANAMARLRDTRDAAAWRAAERDAKRALSDSENRFRTLADTMPQMVWSALPDGYNDYFNARWYAFTGVPEGSTDGEAWSGVFHPDDEARAWAIWRQSLSSGDLYEIEYRMRHADGTYRWVLGRALPVRDGDGAITRWFGTCTDIHEQKLALEEREVISQELSHRIKNIFSVIAGLVSFSARGRPDFAATAAELRERITALGRAHDFVRPHSPRSQPEHRQDSLKGLLAELFAAYQESGAARVKVEGEDVAIDDRSATPLALLFHELATNATKYGALSVPEGRVLVTSARDGDTSVLRWTEHGGPTISHPPQGGGFGTQLIELSAVRQLGGSVERDWRPEGLQVTIRTPCAAMAR